MKKNLLAILFMAVLMFGADGCLTPEQVQQIATQQEKLQSSVNTLQSTAADITQQLTTAGIVDPNLNKKVEHLNAEINKVQADISVVSTAVKNVELTGDSLQDFIAMARAGNAASSAFNPYALPIEAALAVLSGFLAWLAKRKAAEAAKTKTALTEVVVGNEIYKFKAKVDSPDGLVAASFNAAHNTIQSNETREMVASIKAT